MYGKAKLRGLWASHQPQRLKGPMHEDIACFSAGPPVSEAWGAGCQVPVHVLGATSALQVKATPEVLGRRQSARDPFTLYWLLQTSLADDHSLLSAPAEPSLAPTPFPLCRIHPLPLAVARRHLSPMSKCKWQMLFCTVHAGEAVISLVMFIVLRGTT